MSLFDFGITGTGCGLSLPGGHGRASGQGANPLVGLLPMVAIARDLLLHHPPPDEEPAGKGAGIHRGVEGGRPGGHLRRHVREDHPARARSRCSSEIADKVRIEVSRNAIVGYQGQEPVARPRGAGAEPGIVIRSVCAQHEQESSLESSSSSLAVIGLSVWASIHRRQKVKLGLDLKGGVHLVLRVQHRRCAEARDRPDRRAAARGAGHGQHPLRRAGTELIDRRSGWKVSGRRGVSGRKPTEAADAKYNRSAGAGGRYTFTMQPNIANQLRDEAVTQALETIERRVNELGVAEPIVARHGGQDQIAGAAARRRGRRSARRISSAPRRCSS